MLLYSGVWDRSSITFIVLPGVSRPCLHHAVTILGDSQEGLAEAKVMVAFCHEDYGERTLGGSYETFDELKWLGGSGEAPCGPDSMWQQGF